VKGQRRHAGAGHPQAARSRQAGGRGQVGRRGGQAADERTFHRWRNQYGGMKAGGAEELRHLRDENYRLRRMVADLSLDIQNVEGGGPGKLLSPTRRREAYRTQLFPPWR
jgi:putative transposase